jgi:hypothetical protein
MGTVLVLAIGVMASGTAAAQYVVDDMSACQDRIESILLKQEAKAHVSFPASATGITVRPDGGRDHRITAMRVQRYDIGIKPGESATVTRVSLRPYSLQIHLNGGGKGSDYDEFGGPEGSLGMQGYMRPQGPPPWPAESPSAPYALLKKKRSGSADKDTGGSRIVLLLTRPMPCAQLSDPGRLRQFLAPLVQLPPLGR